MLTLNHATVTRLCCIAALLLGGASATQAAEPKRKPAAEKAAPAAPAAPAAATKGGFWQSSRDGWFWYVDPPQDEQEDEDEAPRAPAAPPLSAQDLDLAAHKAFQQRLERAMNAAVINPSEANVAEFLELWAEARRKASVFTDTAQVVAARMPWVDETSQGTRPTNPAAIRVFDQVQADSKDDLMRTLSQTHGIYFFFRGDCAYCHAQAPMLKQLEVKYGFTVFPISMDGGALVHYPKVARDNGMAAQVMAQLRIPEQHLQVPFTVLANPRTHEMLPVGFGPMTADEMVNRIAMVVRVQQMALQPQTNQAPTDALLGLRGALAGAASVSTAGVAR